MIDRAVGGEVAPARRFARPAMRALVGWDAYRAVATAVVAAGFVLRIVDLDNRPLHHDESAHAWFSWLLLTGRGYQYNPVFHGPIQFYVGALAEAVTGVGDTAIRLGPAIFGSATVALPLLLRRQLGSAGALAASVVLCISPSFLYYSRFGREDAYAAFFTLALIVAIFRFLDRPREWHPAVILGLFAACFAAKETAYITAAVFGSFFVAVALWQVRRARASGRPARTSAIVATVRSVGLDAWIWGATAFAFIFTVLFSTFLFRPQGLRNGLYGSIQYWLSQQPVNRGGQPWFYYLVLIPFYELPVVLLALLGVAAALRRPTLFRAFLVWDAVACLVVYSWASERMPWLVLHPLVPLVLLAGVGVQALWAHGRLVRAAAAPVLALGAAFLLYGAVEAAYRHPADPSELLVFTQTSTQFDAARKEVFAVDRRIAVRSRREPRIIVDSWGGTGWPWGWYLRDLPVQYLDLSTTQPLNRPDAVVVTEVNRAQVEPFLRGYVRRRFHLREWWVVPYGEMTPGNVWRWFRYRRPWSPKGYLDEYLYVRARDR